MTSTEEARPLLERAQRTPTSKIEAARLAEAAAVIDGDSARALEAAELYWELEMPYEEARCRLDGRESTGRGSWPRGSCSSSPARRRRGEANASARLSRRSERGEITADEVWLNARALHLLAGGVAR